MCAAWAATACPFAAASLHAAASTGTCGCSLRPDPYQIPSSCTPAQGSTHAACFSYSSAPCCGVDGGACGGALHRCDSSDSDDSMQTTAASSTPPQHASAQICVLRTAPLSVLLRTAAPHLRVLHVAGAHLSHTQVQALPALTQLRALGLEASVLVRLLAHLAHI